jgi:hypothetical protein
MVSITILAVMDINSPKARANEVEEHKSVEAVPWNEVKGVFSPVTPVYGYAGQASRSLVF